MGPDVAGWAIAADVAGWAIAPAGVNCSAGPRKGQTRTPVEVVLAVVPARAALVDSLATVPESERSALPFELAE